MDLLIKNMEMPKEGSVVIEIYSDGVWCDYKSSQHHEKAIELPPHGRLIDADELIEKVLDGDRPNYGTVVRFIQEAPVILEATE